MVIQLHRIRFNTVAVITIATDCPFVNKHKFEMQKKLPIKKKEK